MNETLLKITDLHTVYPTPRGPLHAVNGVSIEVGRGETVGLVGESGCGKSALGLSIMRLIEQPGRIVGGEIRFADENLVTKSEEEMRRLRGKRISMIFQDPTSTLNPVQRVGDQIAEVAIAHGGYSRRQAKDLAIEMLGAVGIANPRQRYDAYPHELSGGMQQRVIIACALALRPQLVVADEPTTALDVTVQEQILDLLRDLAQGQIGTAVVMISHDLGVIAETCVRTYVMYCGKIVEAGTTEALLTQPRHPYTRGLLASIPRVEGEAIPLTPIPGVVADATNPPTGCAFHPRCAFATDLCRTDAPPTREYSGHSVVCHYDLEAI
jgi:oligopeptide/dipeptide ABC transporter ATP-binding protein